MSDYLELIRNNHIKIKNKKQILELIDNYGYHRIINCYGDLLKNLPKKLYNTKNIAKLFNLDKELSKITIYYLLDFEQKLNAKSIVAINEVIGKGNENYILNLNDVNFNNVRNKNFIDDLYASASGCNCLMMYDNPKTIPLTKLSLSWSFHTLITFIDYQNLSTKEKIAARFNIDQKNIANFISTCHSIRKFRNTISHNDIFFITTINFYRREFNQILNYLKKVNVNIEKDITIYSLYCVLEVFLRVDIISEVYKVINNAKLPKKIKFLVLDYLGINL